MHILQSNVAPGIVFGIFLVLALVHLVWALKAKADFGATVLPTLPDGKPVFSPGRAATVVVALMLFVGAAYFLALASGVIGEWTGVFWPARIVTGLFFLRAIGEFRYVGFFKRVRDTAFAKADTRFYSPLCVFIAVLSLLSSFRI